MAKEAHEHILPFIFSLSFHPFSKAPALPSSIICHQNTSKEQPCRWWWWRRMGSGGGAARRVLVVADPTRESTGALQYALSHAVIDKDTLILFHVQNPNAWKNPFIALFKKQNGGGSAIADASLSLMMAEGGGGGREVDFLETMKQVCMKAQPKLKVVVEKMEMAEGDDKASIILAQCHSLKVDVLVVGQRRSLSNAILGSKRGSIRGIDTADYLILNSKCTCVAVQKKGQNAGYLLNSKTYKNFWLLA